MTSLKHTLAGGGQDPVRQEVHWAEGQEKRRKLELDKHGGCLGPLGGAGPHTARAANPGPSRELPGKKKEKENTSLETCVWELIA